MVSLKAFLIVLAIGLAWFGMAAGIEAGKSESGGLRFKIAVTMALASALVAVAIAYLAGAL